MRLEAVRIPGEGVELAGLRYVPGRTPRSTALVFAHGFTAGKYSLDGLASYLAGRGYVGLTFDFVGHKLGATGGEMRHSTQAAENLQAALGWMRAHTEAERIALIGHSMGAGAALAVAAQKWRNPAERGARPAGVVCLCLGTEPTKGFESAVGKAMLEMRRDYVAGAEPLQLLTELGEMIREAEGLQGLPALFVAARQDVLVSVARVEALAALAGESASVTVIESSHLDAPDRARATVIRWLEEKGLV